jgi:hypothetical protein
MSVFYSRQKIFTAICLTFCLILAGCSSPISKPSIESKQFVNAIDLGWQDFYQMPVGPLGLEPTKKLLSLNNKPVRLHGYMVKEEEPTTGIFLLTALPVSLSEKEDGPADDLPAATVFVHLPTTDKQKSVNFRSGLWELVGTLKLGNQEEVGGRVSYVRLML